MNVKIEFLIECEKDGKAEIVGVASTIDAAIKYAESYAKSNDLQRCEGTYPALKDFALYGWKQGHTCKSFIPYIVPDPKDHTEDQEWFLPIKITNIYCDI